MLKCKSCMFKRNVPGSAHVSCSRPSTGVVNVEQHGIDNGWFFFPFDYDPVWAEECTSYISKETDFDSMTREDLLSFLGVEVLKLKEMNSVGFKHVHEIQRLSVFQSLKAWLENYDRVEPFREDSSKEEVLSLVKSIIKF